MVSAYFFIVSVKVINKECAFVPVSCCEVQEIFLKLRKLISAGLPTVMSRKCMYLPTTRCWNCASFFWESVIVVPLTSCADILFVSLPMDWFSLLTSVFFSLSSTYVFTSRIFEFTNESSAVMLMRFWIFLFNGHLHSLSSIRSHIGFLHECRLVCMCWFSLVFFWKSDRLHGNYKLNGNTIRRISKT